MNFKEILLVETENSKYSKISDARMKYFGDVRRCLKDAAVKGEREFTLRHNDYTYINTIRELAIKDGLAAEFISFVTNEDGIKTNLTLEISW